jgi:hypothetical protein
VAEVSKLQTSNALANRFSGPFVILSLCNFFSLNVFFSATFFSARAGQLVLFHVRLQNRKWVKLQTFKKSINRNGCPTRKPSFAVPSAY